MDGLREIMKKDFFYSQKALLIIKAIAIIAFIILMVCDFLILFETSFFKAFTNNQLFVFIEDFVVATVCVILFFYPQRYSLIGICSLWYSIVISTVSVDNMMCIIMFLLTLCTFLIRGVFRTKKQIKAVIVILVYLYELLISLRFGFKLFVECSLLKIGYTFVIVLCIYLYSEFHLSNVLIELNDKNHILNLADYDGINRCDIDLLERVLRNKKYKEIAFELHGNPGTIRNRLNKLYDILSTGDRTGFILKYNGYKIVYEPED